MNLNFLNGLKKIGSQHFGSHKFSIQSIKSLFGCGVKRDFLF